MGDLVGVCFVNSDGFVSLVPSCDFLGLRNIIGFVHDYHLIGDFLFTPRV